MSFASLTFLFLFLPVFFSVYYGALGMRASVRVLNWIALSSSILFFAWGAPRFVPILALSCLIDYLMSKKIAAEGTAERTRRSLLTASIVLNVGMLGYFKYANFFVEQTNLLLTSAGGSAFAWTPVLLPIGISFITFEKLSYIIDVFRRTTAPAPDFTTFLLFIALFPHLIAGPIFRYHDLAEQLVHRKHSLDLATSGVLRFITGLAKKVLVADTLAVIADQTFTMDPANLNFTRAWIGIIAYAYQIYFDFSGYSDMAIGLGRMMGFRFLENFDNPYIAQNITEFWRRWHISLSSWLREYLYFPLGGNRISTARTYLNLWIVFLISGLWHGANWTFVAWGAFHGFFLMLDKLFLIRLMERLPKLFRVFVTFVIVLSGWVLFRSNTIGQAGVYLSHMFLLAPGNSDPHMPLVYSLHAKTIFFFGVATMLSFYPLLNGRRQIVAAKFSPSAGRLQLACCGAAAICLLILSAASLTNSTFHPFIYFRF